MGMDEMDVDLNNPLEIQEVGMKALQDALGPVGMVRFIQLFDSGRGNYTAEKQNEKDITINEFEEMLKRNYLEKNLTLNN